MRREDLASPDEIKQALNILSQAHADRPEDYGPPSLVIAEDFERQARKLLRHLLVLEQLAAEDELQGDPDLINCVLDLAPNQAHYQTDMQAAADVLIASMCLRDALQENNAEQAAQEAMILMASGLYLGVSMDAMIVAPDVKFAKKRREQEKAFGKAGGEHKARTSAQLKAIVNAEAKRIKAENPAKTKASKRQIAELIKRNLGLRESAETIRKLLI